MKEQYLQLNYRFKTKMRTLRAHYFWKLVIFLLSLFMIACSGESSDKISMLPKPLYTQPQNILANPKGGYSLNQLTKDSIQPLVNSLGDTLVTGSPLTIKLKLIKPQSISLPKVIKAPDLSSLKKFKAHPNRKEIQENLLPTFKVDESKLNKIKLGEGNQDFVLLSSTGDTIPSGIPITATGKLVKAKYPKPTNALSFSSKEGANTNIQFLDVDQGMPSSYLYSSLEDNKGNLWFGTQGAGVAKYDGENFVNFTENEGLSHNYVISILEDKSGNLWFGTWGGGLTKFDGEYFIHFTEKEGLSSNYIRSIFEDSNGNIWIGTEKGAASKFEPSFEKNVGYFTHYTQKEGLKANVVTSIFEDSSGNLWFGSSTNGVFRFEISGNSTFTHFTKEDGLSSTGIWTIIEDQGGALWFGTQSGVTKYIQLTDSQMGAFTHFTSEVGLGESDVRTILEDQNGALWFGTYGEGVIEYKPSNDNQKATFTHFTIKEGLSDNKLWSILEDKAGYLWFSTFGGGVNRYKSSSFTHLSEKEGLSNKLVYSILEDKVGNIWISTWGGGISKYDGETFIHITNKEGMSGNDVMSSLMDKDGNLWFGTIYNGVTKFQPPKNGEVGTFTYYTTAEGLSGNSVYSIIEDKNGNIWFGTFNGITKYEPSQNGEAGSFYHITEKEGLSNNTVYSITEDKEGNIWFGTYGGGVSKFSPAVNGQEETITHYTEKEGLSGRFVWSIGKDTSGDLWFGTQGAGVNKYESSQDKKMRSFTHFTQKEGLSDDYVYNVLEYQPGSYFVATERGLTSIIVDSTRMIEESNAPYYSVTNLTKQDGLKGLDFILNSAFIDSKNRIWWGTGKGLTKLNIDELNQVQNRPVVRLTQIDINEQFIDYRNISDSLSKQIVFSEVPIFENYPLNLELPYNKNHLSFYFSAIDEGLTPDKIQYSHRILGFSNTWSTPSKEIKADYRNLVRGTYTFQITAIGESNEWSEPFEYTFTINPPWWHSWWAYCLYALLFLSALRIFSKWREKKLRIEKEELQLKVEERTSELKLSLENLKSTQSQLIQSEKMASLGELTAGIAHEIQNPLNFVNNFSELNKELVLEAYEEFENKDYEEVKSILKDIEANSERINHHGKRADNIVKGMLQHSRASGNKKEATDINALADEYMRLAYHGLRAKDKSFNANLESDFDDTLEKIKVIPQDIGRVILNLFTNAFYAVTEKKESLSETESKIYRPTVSVSTKKIEEFIQICVRDNGNGIPNEVLNKIFQPFFTTKPTGKGTGLGLSMSYDIIKAHGGKLEVKTEKGKYTEFTITIPI